MSNLGDRRTYLGCSDIGAALGFSPWMTRHDLWEYKTGRMPGKVQTPRMQRGHDMEPIIAKLYNKKTIRGVRRRQAEFTGEATGRPWLKYHADGLTNYIPGRIPADIPTMEKGLLEFKAPDPRTVRSYLETGLPDDYIFQAQCGMFLSGMPWLGFAVYDYENNEVIDFDIKRDDAFIEQMLPRIDEFWACVVNDTPPPQAVEPLVVPNINTELVYLTGAAYDELADIFVSARADTLMAEAAEEAVLDKIKAILDEKGLGLVSMASGGIRISYKHSKPRRSYQGEKLSRWTDELCKAIRSGDQDLVAKMAAGYLPSNFYTDTSYRAFIPTFYGDFKEEIAHAKG
jgi:putative phage-type endonuclease